MANGPETRDDSNQPEAQDAASTPEPSRSSPPAVPRPAPPPVPKPAAQQVASTPPQPAPDASAAAGQPSATSAPPTAAASSPPAAGVPSAPPSGPPATTAGGEGQVDFDAVAGGSGPPAGVDLSAFDTDALPDVPLGDDEALKKINRRTSPFGRLVAFSLIALVFGGGAFVWWITTKQGEQQAALSAIGSEEDPEVVKQRLRELLPKTSSTNLQQRILKNLGHYRDEEAVPLIVQSLDDGHVVRRDAAWALARIGSPAADIAKEKLLQLLPQTDDRDRAQVVWTLAVLGEARAADAVVEQFSKGMLQRLDGFDAGVITRVLGPARLGSDELLNHQEESVRRLTAHALGEVASPEVVDPLTRLLRAELAREDDKQSQEVIRAAAAGLGRTGDPRAARPLFEVLQNIPNLAQSVLDALRASSAAPELATLTKEASDPAVKRDMVRLLASTHDGRIADYLAELQQSEDAEIRQTAAFALADIRDARAAPVLLELARSEETSTADRALGALHKVATPAISDALVSMLKDMEYRRATILRIMGATGDQELGKHVEGSLSTDDAGAAAEALARLDYEPAYRKLLDFVPLPRGEDMGARNAAERSLTKEDLLRKRKAGVLAMGLYGRPDAFETLTEVVEDDVKEDYELRAMAATAIGRLASPDQIRTVIQRVRNTELDERSRRYYVQALWQRPHPELNQEMLSLIADADVPIPVRRAAALTVGYTADPANDAKLIELLADEGARRHAALAIALGGGDDAVEELVGVLPQDIDTREILQNALMNDTNDWFNLVTEEMVTGGQVYRRLRAAWIMKQGDAEQSFGYAWAQAVNVLRSGWGGPGGASDHFIRMHLFEDLMADDTPEERRRLAAETLAAIPERGLLLRARDEGGKGGAEARAILQGGKKNPAS